MDDAPPTPELLAWALDALASVGVTQPQLRALAQVVPERLVGPFV